MGEKLSQNPIEPIDINISDNDLVILDTCYKVDKLPPNPEIKIINKYYDGIQSSITLGLPNIKTQEELKKFTEELSKGTPQKKDINGKIILKVKGTPECK